MKTFYIILSFAALCLTATIESTAYASIFNTRSGGDSKNVKSKIKEKTPVNSENSNTSVSTETDFSYLRFDVTKYERQDLQESNDGSSDIEVTDNEFSYLKFDVSRYDKNDNSISEEIDAINHQPDPDFSYLRFDVTKYAGNDEDTSDELMNY
jgi:hypothetical protein